MTLPQSGRKKKIVAFIVGGLALLIVLALVFIVMHTHHRQLRSATGPSITSMDLVDQLVESVRDDTPVSIVQFKTDLVGAPPTPATIAEYSSPVNFGGPFSLRVKGTFQLIQSLHLRFSNWGRVDRAVPDVDSRWSGNENYHRLRPLLSLSVEQPSTTLLAVTSPYTNSPVDSRFIGPLTPGDVEWLPQFVEALLAERPKKMSKKRAAELVRSPNPWLVELGLWRLRAEKVLAANDFVAAMAARSPDDAQRVLAEMLDAAFLSKFSNQDLTQAVAEMIRLPDRQMGVLEALNEWLPRDGYGVRTHLDLPPLQISARKYRDQLLAEGRHPEIVAELDRLLAF
jgi:hypothetical protein